MTIEERRDFMFRIGEFSKIGKVDCVEKRALGNVISYA